MSDTVQRIVSCFLFTCVLVSCKRTDTPKPLGYLRIDLPKASYQTALLEEMPFVFNVSAHAIVEIPTDETVTTASQNLSSQTSRESSSTEPATLWLNIDYPQLKAKIYCSYLPTTPQQLETLEEECRRFMLQSAKNANAINEKTFENRAQHVYGVLFLIEGATVSPVQFILTDSISHFFRGALYYKEHTSRPDSIAPITEYLSKDVVELVQSFSWK